MRRRRVARRTPDTSVTEAALDAMDAPELRSLIRDIIPWLDDATLARFLNALVDRAARNPSGWVPEGPGDAVVAEVVRRGQAEVGGAHAVAFEGEVDAGDLVVGAAQGAEDEEVGLGLGSDDPFASSGLDEGSDGEGHGGEASPLPYDPVAAADRLAS